MARIISTCGLIHLLPEHGTLYHVDLWFHGTLACLVIINPLTKLSLRPPVLGSSRGACWITLATWTKPPGHIPQDRARSIILATWAPCDAIPTSSSEFNGMAFRSTWHEAPQTAQNMAGRDHIDPTGLTNPYDFDQSRGHKRPTSLPTLRGTKLSNECRKKGLFFNGRRFWKFIGWLRWIDFMEPFGTGWKVSDPLKKHSCWSASIVTTQVYRKQILNKRVKPLAFKSQTLVVPIQHLAKNMAMKRCNLAFLRTFITFALGPNMAMASFVFDQRKKLICPCGSGQESRSFSISKADHWTTSQWAGLDFFFPWFRCKRKVVRVGQDEWQMQVFCSQLL